jgi:CrcB protein
LTAYLIVFLGAGLGGALRHGINQLVARLVATDFPLATLLINVSGSFAMGLLAGWLAFRGDAPQHWRLFLATGVLGGYTTFSAFSLDAVLLWERGAWGAAGVLRRRLGRVFDRGARGRALAGAELGLSGDASISARHAGA